MEPITCDACGKTTKDGGWLVTDSYRTLEDCDEDGLMGDLDCPPGTPGYMPTVACDWGCLARVALSTEREDDNGHNVWNDIIDYAQKQLAKETDRVEGT